MAETAEILGEDKRLWGLTGLLHDLDYDYTEGDPVDHAKLSIKILDGLLPKQGLNAIRSHNYKHTDYYPVNPIDKALIAADETTNLIFEILKKTNSEKQGKINHRFLMKKLENNPGLFDQSQKKIKLCEDLGINHVEFMKMSLRKIKQILKNQKTSSSLLESFNK